MRGRYPMLLEVSDRLVVIVGAGSVAVRKAKALLSCGAARVRVIAPQVADDMPAAVERIQREYSGGDDLEDAWLVFAATDSPQANSRVVEDARRRGIFVNRADDEDDGDFITPAMYVAGPIQITVSGGSAALSARVRDEIAEHLDPRWQTMAEAMRLLRPRVTGARHLAAQRRREIFHAMLSDEAIAQATSGGAESLWNWILVRFPELSGGS